MTWSLLEFWKVARSRPARVPKMKQSLQRISEEDTKSTEDFWRWRKAYLKYANLWTNTRELNLPRSLFRNSPEKLYQDTDHFIKMVCKLLLLNNAKRHLRGFTGCLIMFQGPVVNVQPVDVKLNVNFFSSISFKKDSTFLTAKYWNTTGIKQLRNTRYCTR